MTYEQARDVINLCSSVRRFLIVQWLACHPGFHTRKELREALSLEADPLRLCLERLEPVLVQQADSTPSFMVANEACITVSQALSTLCVWEQLEPGRPLDAARCAVRLQILARPTTVAILSAIAMQANQSENGWVPTPVLVASLPYSANLYPLLGALQTAGFVQRKRQGYCVADMGGFAVAVLVELFGITPKQAAGQLAMN